MAWPGGAQRGSRFIFGLCRSPLNLRRLGPTPRFCAGRPRPASLLGLGGLVKETFYRYL